MKAPGIDSVPAPQDLIERHKAFWRRDAAEPPLLYDGPSQPCFASVRSMYSAEAGRPIGPEQADAARYLAAVDWQSAWAPGEADLLMVLPPNPRIPWLEAIAGSKVVPDPVSDSVWSVEPDDMPEAPEAVEAQEAWIGTLQRQLDDLEAHAPVPVPLSQTVMRGPGDVIEALIGATGLLYAAMDGAAWLRPLIESVTDLFIRVARVQWERIGPAWGGYVNWFGFWSPEPCVRVQEDVQRIFTPELYRLWLRPALSRIAEAFPYSMFHMHSGSLNMVEEVASVPGLSALEVYVDEPPYELPITEQIDQLRAAQRHCPLFIEGPMTREDVEHLMRELSPRGLAISRHRFFG